MQKYCIIKNKVEVINLSKQKQIKSTSIFWRVMISLIGISLILIATSNIFLFFFGENATAQITKRRYGGSTGREYNIRYSWAIDYTFKDEKGIIYGGHTTKYGNDMTVNLSNKVYYFTRAPFINALEYEVSPNLGQLFVMAIGVFLIYAMNNKKKSKKIPELIIKYDYENKVFQEKNIKE